jgi:hypothetical protein
MIKKSTACSPPRHVAADKSGCCQRRGSVTQRPKIGDQTYTVAAKAVPNRIAVEQKSNGSSAVFSAAIRLQFWFEAPEKYALNGLLMTSLRKRRSKLGSPIPSSVIIGWSILFPANDRQTDPAVGASNASTGTRRSHSPQIIVLKYFHKMKPDNLAHAFFNRMANSIASLSETGPRQQPSSRTTSQSKAKALRDVTIRMHRFTQHR